MKVKTRKSWASRTGSNLKKGTEQLACNGPKLMGTLLGGHDLTYFIHWQIYVIAPQANMLKMIRYRFHLFKLLHCNWM